MKKALYCLLILSLVLPVLLGCSSSLDRVEKTQETESVTTQAPSRTVLDKAEATDADVAALDALYAGRNPFHGDMHDHSSVGDGNVDLATWKENLAALNLDFQAILDHRKVKHMYLPEWKYPHAKDSEILDQVCVIKPHLFLKGPMVTSLSYNTKRERGYPDILRMIEHG